jgi:hypothetical protein
MLLPMTKGNTLRYWLEDEAGRRVRVGFGGVVLGREERCEIISRDPGASRRHALVAPAGGSLELMHTGLNPTCRNDTPVDGVVRLADGDRVSIPGLKLRVVVESGAIDAQAPSWLLDDGAGQVYGVAQSPFSIGNDPEDDLSIPAWPPSAIRLSVVQTELLAEALCPMERNGTPMEVGEYEPLNHGDVLSLAGEQLTAIAIGGGSAATTVLQEIDALPSRLEFQFFPRGGRLHLGTPAGEVTVWLSELRADLVAALLTERSGHGESDFLDDEWLIAKVWPGQPEKDKRDLNLLVHRVRKALIDGGLNGKRLLERAPQGGATRFRRQPGAPVTFAT